MVLKGTMVFKGNVINAKNGMNGLEMTQIA